MNLLTIPELQALADRSIGANVPVPDQFKDGTPYHAFLYLLAQALNPQLIVELGVGREARGAAHFALGAPEALVAGVDLEPPTLVPYPNIRWWKGDTLSAPIHNTISILAPSIDILFIDSEHLTERALAEYHLYSPLVEKGGIILFDDINIRGMEGLWEKIPEPKFNHSGLHTVQGFGVNIKE